MRKTALIAAVLGFAALPLIHGSALAQVAAPQQMAAVAQPAKEVSPRDLMTFRERFDMWRAMRNARTMDAKMELWATKRAELEKRATERGLVLRCDHPMMRNGQQGRGGEMRMSMMSQGGGSMMPRPPAGR